MDGGDNVQVGFEGVAPVTHEIKDNGPGEFRVFLLDKNGVQRLAPAVC